MNLPMDPVPGRAEDPRSSWLEIGASGVDLAALKVADSGDALVLRLVEMHGREVSFDLAIGWEANRITKCNLREVPTGETREIEGGSTSVTLSPFEVCTFRVE
jgi:alpha-mannosidase